MTAPKTDNIIAAPDDSVESIAYRAGHFWETVWKRDENESLRAQRSSPHQLVPGDVVFVPEIEPKTVTRVTGGTYVFRRRGVPSWLRVVLRYEGKPRSGVEYALEIDGVVTTGTTGDDGLIERALPPDAKSARLRIGSGLGARVLTLHVRGLQPVTEIAGVQARLANLGYSPGPVNGTWSDRAAAALADFQKATGLEATGELTDDARAKLVEKHGS